MKKTLLYIYIGVLCVTLVSCKKVRNGRLHNSDITKVIKNITEVMVHDVTSPPLAARFYAYTCLAGYEVVSQNDSSLKSMYGILNDYPKILRIKIFRTTILL